MPSPPPPTKESPTKESPTRESPTRESNDSSKMSPDLRSPDLRRADTRPSSPRPSSSRPSSSRASSSRASSPRAPSASSSAHAKHERIRQRALRDLMGLRHEGGGFGAGWTQSALVRSLVRTNREASDITPRLRRVIVFLRVLSFVALSLWVIYYLANH